MTVEGISNPFLLDSGAELSVMPKHVLQLTALPQPLDFYRLRNEAGDLLPDKIVRSFGGHPLMLEGPFVFTVFVCGVQLKHPFYTLDLPTPFVAGYDFITAAALLIDPVERRVCSKHITGSASICLPPIIPPAPTTPLNIVVNSTPLHDPEHATNTSTARLCENGSTGDKSFLPHCEATTPKTLLFQDAQSLYFSSSLLDLQNNLDLQPQQVNTVNTFISSPLATPASCVPPHSVTLPITPPPDGSLPPLHTTTPFMRVPPTDHPPPALPASGPPSTTGSVNDTVVTSHVRSSPVNVDVFSDVDTGIAASRVSFTQDADDLPDHLQNLFLTTVDEGNLTSDMIADFKTLLHNHADTFAKSSTDIGYCDLLQHDIDTYDHAPIKQPPRRPPLAARDAEDRLLDEMLSCGVIEPSQSPWSSPVCLVKRKDGAYRFCVDYRRLNSITKRDSFPVPNIQDALDSLKGARYYIQLDLLSSYYQLPMTDRAKERSAFCTRRGLYQFTRMSFGLCNAPATFCRLMHHVLRDYLWQICLFYVDDIILFARTQHELLQRFNLILNRLRDVGLKVKPSKCSLFKTQVAFLGHLVSEHGIDPMPDKLQAIKDWPTPKCLRDVRAFYGLASYYRRFVKSFATKSEALTRLMRKNATFCWTSEAQQAFENLKEALCNTV